MTIMFRVLRTSLLLLFLIYTITATICPSGQQPCGSFDCYDPTIQGCDQSGHVIQCFNSCNGTCYSNSQYCYNNSVVYNNGESACYVQTYSADYYPTGPTCYDSSRIACHNGTMCYSKYSCGTDCYASYTACVNDQTACPGFRYYNRNVNLCGSNQQCYDNTTSVCLNNTTVCPRSYSLLCGTKCWDPSKANCVSGSLQCINSCNGTCYSNSQYCYNNSVVCNNGESACYVQRNTYNYFPTGLTCYNSSRIACHNGTMCYSDYSCGADCYDYHTVCVNNQTACPGFNSYNQNVNLYGPSQQCYDNTTDVCLNNTTVCPIGNLSCSGQCYDPQAAYCVGGNNSVYCLNNPTSMYCSQTTTSSPMTPIVSSSCCGNKYCSSNADCCDSNTDSCQCYRQKLNDVFGYCLNSTALPGCSGGCPFVGPCRMDSDCCRCQCATISFLTVHGTTVQRNQCVAR